MGRETFRAYFINAKDLIDLLQALNCTFVALIDEIMFDQPKEKNQFKELEAAILAMKHKFEHSL